MFCRKEIFEGGQILKGKMLKYLPKIALFNGKGIYEVFCGHKNFNFGLQPDPFPGCPDTVSVIVGRILINMVWRWYYVWMQDEKQNGKKYNFQYFVIDFSILTNYFPSICALEVIYLKISFVGECRLEMNILLLILY